MHILIQAPHHEHLVVIVHRLSSKEFLRLLQAALLPLNLILLRIIHIAVRDPTLIPTKYQQLRIWECKRAYSIPRWPLIILICNFKQLPLLLLTIGVQPLNRIQRCLCHRISAPYHIQVSRLKHWDRVIVSTLMQLTNLSPLILGYIIYLTSLGCVVGVLTPNCIDQICRLKFKSTMQVGNLMPTLTIFHFCFGFQFVGLFI